MKECNEHHIIQKFDRKCGLIPKRTNLNHPSNKIMLPVETHDELHAIINGNEMFKYNVNSRIYIANMAYNEELDLVPERFYLKEPMIIRK